MRCVSSSRGGRGHRPLGERISPTRNRRLRSNRPRGRCAPEPARNPRIKPAESRRSARSNRGPRHARWPMLPLPQLSGKRPETSRRRSLLFCMKRLLVWANYPGISLTGAPASDPSDLASALPYQHQDTSGKAVPHSLSAQPKPSFSSGPANKALRKTLSRAWPAALSRTDRSSVVRTVSPQTRQMSSL